MPFTRSDTRKIKIGTQVIGGGNPVLIQSMTNTDTRNVDETVRQIIVLEDAGCDIVRVSVYDTACVKSIGEIKKKDHGAAGGGHPF